MALALTLNWRIDLKDHIIKGVAKYNYCATNQDKKRGLNLLVSGIHVENVSIDGFDTEFRKSNDSIVKLNFPIADTESPSGDQRHEESEISIYYRIMSDNPFICWFSTINSKSDKKVI